MSHDNIANLLQLRITTHDASSVLDVAKFVLDIVSPFTC